MKELLEFIVSQIVDKPKEVKISQSAQDGEIVLTLSVAPEDMGKVIGKNGQIIRALRSLLRTAAFKQDKKVQLVLEEVKKQTD